MQRNIALDITKGIGILLVILGHCGSIPYMPIRHFIFTFHMPLFFLVSGYLYKAKNAKDSIKKDLVRLGLPYAFTCLAIVLYYFLYFLISKTHNSEPLRRFYLHRYGVVVHIILVNIFRIYQSLVQFGFFLLYFSVRMFITFSLVAIASSSLLSFLFLLL